MPKKNFFEKLNDAVDGFIHATKTEPNMRTHFFLGFLVVFAGLLLGVSRVELIILCMTVSVVWITELINTAIEEMADLVELATHPGVRLIKDVAAGAVLISALNALIIGFLIFSKFLHWPLDLVALKVKYAPWTISFAAFLLVVFLVVAAKLVSHRGTPFKGGVVSGHAAVAFSLWTSILFMQNNFYILSATFLLACLVAYSRFRIKVHSFWEVLGGALLGTLATAVLFKILG